VFTLENLQDARRQVHSAFDGTPQYNWPLLAERTGAEVWVKHENHAPTGAFKVRGGLIYMARLAQSGWAPNGIVSQTRGNHGQSLGYAGLRFGVPVSVVVPVGNSVEKNAAMRSLGVHLIEHGEDFDAARAEAERLASQKGLLAVASFHPDLVLGVATWALELFEAVADLDALYVPIGLGSSICGAIRVRDLLGLRTEIIGVQSTLAPAYSRSMKAGHVVSVETAHTKADGLAVRVPDATALDIIIGGAARIVDVTDDEIAAAMRAYWTDTHNLAEGAGAAPLAALLRERERMVGKRVGLVLSGGNIDLDLFRRWAMP
jgi:threonine dehydratase